MGSPMLAPGAAHPILLFDLELLTRLQRAGLGGLMGEDCTSATCARESWEQARVPLRPRACSFTSVFSRRDGIVDWRSCLDPQAETVEVRTSHLGMAFDPVVLDVVTDALAAHRARRTRSSAGRPGWRQFPTRRWVSPAPRAGHRGGLAVAPRTSSRTRSSSSARSGALAVGRPRPSRTSIASVAAMNESPAPTVSTTSVGGAGTRQPRAVGERHRALGAAGEDHQLGAVAGQQRRGRRPPRRDVRAQQPQVLVAELDQPGAGARSPPRRARRSRGRRGRTARMLGS